MWAPRLVVVRVEVVSGEEARNRRLERSFISVSFSRVHVLESSECVRAKGQVDDKRSGLRERGIS